MFEFVRWCADLEREPHQFMYRETPEDKEQTKSIKNNFTKYNKHFQDPTRNLSDPMFEFARWCPYLELESHKFLHNEM